MRFFMDGFPIYNVEKIVKANSMLEWISLIKNHLDSHHKFLKIEYRGQVEEFYKGELNDYYYYLSEDLIAFALPIVRYSKLDYLDFKVGSDLITFIESNYIKINKILKMKVFL